MGTGIANAKIFCIVGLMEVQHNPVIHLINMISGKDRTYSGQAPYSGSDRSHLQYLYAIHCCYSSHRRRYGSTLSNIATRSRGIPIRYGYSGPGAADTVSSTPAVSTELIIRKGKSIMRYLISNATAELGNLGCQNTKTVSVLQPHGYHFFLIISSPLSSLSTCCNK